VVVVAVAGVAAIAGDNRGYLLGRRLGRRVLAREGRWQRHRRALLGGIAWAASVGGAAYALGASGARVLAAAGAIALATVIAVIVLSSRRRRRATAPAKPPTPSITTGGAHVPC